MTDFVWLSERSDRRERSEFHTTPSKIGRLSFPEGATLTGRSPLGYLWDAKGDSPAGANTRRGSAMNKAVCVQPKEPTKVSRSKTRSTSSCTSDLWIPSFDGMTEGCVRSARRLLACRGEIPARPRHETTGLR